MPDMNDNLIADFQDLVLPSTTWKIDFNKNVVTVPITGVDAIKQAVNIILASERYEYEIFSNQFGVELDELIGENQQYAMSEIKRRVIEALSQDDRISEVTDFEYARNKTTLIATFTIVCNLGQFEAETEVTL